MHITGRISIGVIHQGSCHKPKTKPAAAFTGLVVYRQDNSIFGNNNLLLVSNFRLPLIAFSRLVLIPGCRLFLVAGSKLLLIFGHGLLLIIRSEERRVGKECVSKGRTR